jgi:hypothetical protein
MAHMDELIAVLLEARALVALPGNDFSWSSFRDQESALHEIDGAIAALRAGDTRTAAAAALFLPTGPLQELSLDSGGRRVRRARRPLRPRLLRARRQGDPLLQPVRPRRGDPHLRRW